MKFSSPLPVPQVALRPLNPADGPLPERRPQPTTAQTATQRVKGTKGIMEKLTITTPPDVLSFIGHTLGFWPQESLVCITLNENSIGATLRIDLPRQPGQELPYARTVAHYLTSETTAASILFAVYTSETSQHGQARPYAAPSPRLPKYSPHRASPSGTDSSSGTKPSPPTTANPAPASPCPSAPPRPAPSTPNSSTEAASSNPRTGSPSRAATSQRPKQSPSNTT
jgi:hypothetical protein